MLTAPIEAAISGLGDLDAMRSESIQGLSVITVLMIYSGFQGVDQNKIKLAQTFGATKGQILRKIVLPGSVPTLIAALR